MKDNAIGEAAVICAEFTLNAECRKLEISRSADEWWAILRNSRNRNIAVALGYKQGVIAYETFRSDEFENRWPAQVHPVLNWGKFFAIPICFSHIVVLLWST